MGDRGPGTERNDLARRCLIRETRIRIVGPLWMVGARRVDDVDEEDMARRITHVRHGGTAKTHESITAYKWHDDRTGIGQDSKPVMVDWVDNNRGQANVSNGYARATAGVVRPATGNPYLRTYADGVWTDNLLSLPAF